MPNSVSPGCFYKLLRTDDSSTQAMTVEGWVKIGQPTDGSEPGGYVLSTGEDSGRTGANSKCANKDTSSRTWVNMCQVSTLCVLTPSQTPAPALIVKFSALPMTAPLPPARHGRG